MRKHFARVLRWIAHRLDPDPIKSLNVWWAANQQTYVDIQLQGPRPQRVTGYVNPVPRVSH